MDLQSRPRSLFCAVRSRLQRVMWILMVVFLLTALLPACSNNLNNNTGSSNTDTETGSEDISPTQTPKSKNRPTSTPGDAPESNSSSSTGQNDNTWTVMLYEDADDEVLEEDMFYDLNEAELAGSSDQVTIVAQVDRYKGGFKGSQNWTSARRYLIQQDDDYETLGSEMLEDLGEVNMADGATLVNFITWAVENYPAGHYVLVLSDHGSGWPGGWTDASAAEDSSTPLSEGFGDMLFLNEIEDALAQVQQQGAVTKFDLIGFDACLMAQVEVMAAVQPYARYAVFSEETEPSLGWAYTAFLSRLKENPAMQPSELAASIVDSYIEEDLMVTDDTARSAYAERAYGERNLSADEVSRSEMKSVTLTAVDLEAAPILWEAIDRFALALPDMEEKTVAAARKYARSFENIFSDISSNGDPYIDLGSFAKVVHNGPRPQNVLDAASGLVDALDKVIIAEKHGSQKKGAMGLSIYFPNAKLFKNEVSGYDTYTSTARTFAAATLWDDYLTFFYTGQPIEQSSQGPEKDAEIIAPGAGEMTISPIELDTDTAAIGEPVNLQTVIQGDSVGYIYIFTGYYDEESDAVLIVDIDFLDSEVIRDVDGVVFPDWQEQGQVTVDFDWEPYQYMLDDGETQVPALLMPDTYGAGTEDTLYTVDGYYLANGESEKRYATLTFDGDGNLVQMVAFEGIEAAGAVREVLPEPGDQFTVLDQWYDLSTDNEDIIYQEGETLTFGDTPITWTDAEAPTGAYILGIIAEDFEGNTVEEYARVEVQ